MQVAVRSYFTAGVAVVATSALLMAPVSASAPPTIQIPAISSAKVELAALVNPFELWAQVAANTVGNVSGLLNTVLENPAPILGQAVGNQLATGQAMFALLGNFGERLLQQVALTPERLQAAFDQIRAGDFAQGIPAIPLAFITPIIGAALFLLAPAVTNINAALQNPFKNIANAIGAVISFETMLGLGLPLVSEIIAPFGQIGFTIQAVFDGVKAGDLEAVANALISFPSDMVNTILNGSPAFGNAGLLNATNGFFAGLLTLRQSIADALTPPVFVPLPPVPPATLAGAAAADATTSAISSLPEASGSTVTLTTAVDTPNVDVTEVAVVDAAEEVTVEEVAVAEETVVEDTAVDEVTEEAATEELAEVAEPTAEIKDVKRVAPRAARTGVKRAANPSAA